MNLKKINILKNKGLSLVELMVALSLAIMLLLGVLTFYTVTQRSFIDSQAVIRETTQRTNMLNMLAHNISDTGSFGCLTKEQIFADPTAKLAEKLMDGETDERKRLLKNFISLGDNRTRQQVVFVHPITKERLYESFGITDHTPTKARRESFMQTPLSYSSNCGNDTNVNDIYVGSTVFEATTYHNQVYTKITDNGFDDIEDNNIYFKLFSTYDQRQTVISDLGNELDMQVKSNNTQGFRNIKVNYKFLAEAYNRGYFLDNYRIVFPDGYGLIGLGYYSDGLIPLIYSSYYHGPQLLDKNYISSGFTLLRSSQSESEGLTFGKNDITIELGFADNPKSTKVPKTTTSIASEILSSGGWINPFASDNIYNTLVDKSSLTPEQAQLFNKTLHHSNDTDGYNMRTYPLKDEYMRQLRAIKFNITEGAWNGRAEKTYSRIVRFNALHLLSLEDVVDEVD